MNPENTTYEKRRSQQINYRMNFQTSYFPPSLEASHSIVILLLKEPPVPSSSSALSRSIRSYLQLILYNVLDRSLLQETKLPARLINTTNERRLVQGQKTQLRAKGNIEDISSEVDNEG
ncbi:hypothetical protein TNCV_2723201 [Trichonephila clavipes]|nr:hypothetical protein TNCV_2723201 [Trichonephila clavipes]